MKVLLAFGFFISVCMSSAADVMNTQIDAGGLNYQGNLMVNQAAGREHQQVNSRTIALAPIGAVGIHIEQNIETLAVDSSLVSVARIDGDSFSNGSGVVGVNQSAGVANQQINHVSVILITLPDSLDDSVLAQNVTRQMSPISTVSTSLGERRAELSDDAFAGSRGVVQLNQSSGIGNSTANHLSIRVAD